MKWQESVFCRWGIEIGAESLQLNDGHRVTLPKAIAQVYCLYHGRDLNGAPMVDKCLTDRVLARRAIAQEHVAREKGHQTTHFFGALVGTLEDMGYRWTTDNQVKAFLLKLSYFEVSQMIPCL